jgi:hypothetical protein
LAAVERDHVTIVNTAYSKPFTVNGISQWIRNWLARTRDPVRDGYTEAKIEPTDHNGAKTVQGLSYDDGAVSIPAAAALTADPTVEAAQQNNHDDDNENERMIARTSPIDVALYPPAFVALRSVAIIPRGRSIRPCLATGWLSRRGL